MSILSRFTPNIEIYSIDEAFLKFEGFDNYNLESYCQNIKDMVRIKAQNNLSVTIGLQMVLMPEYSDQIILFIIKSKIKWDLK